MTTTPNSNAAAACAHSDDSELKVSNLRLQNTKLEAEIKALGRSPLATSWPGFLAAAAACIGILIQCSVMGLERRRAELDRQVANLEKLRLEDSVKQEAGYLAALKQEHTELQRQLVGINKVLANKKQQLSATLHQVESISRTLLAQKNFSPPDNTLVWGLVIDDETGNPIRAVVEYWEFSDLQVSDPNALKREPVSTNDAGFFVVPVEGVVGGENHIVVSASGYKSSTIYFDSHQLPHMRIVALSKS